jgi:hypothetical protein
MIDQRQYAPATVRNRDFILDFLHDVENAAVSSIQETATVCPDFLVELRGFEPLTSAVQASVRFTPLPIPVLQGLVPKVRRWIRRYSGAASQPAQRQRLDGFLDHRGRRHRPVSHKAVDSVARLSSLCFCTPSASEFAASLARLLKPRVLPTYGLEALYDDIDIKGVKFDTPADPASILASNERRSRPAKGFQDYFATMR